MVRRLLVFVVASPLAALLFGQDASLSVTGDIPATGNLTRSDLAQLPHRRLSMRNPHSSAEASYEGVPVVEILKRVRAPLGSDLKGKAMASYVVAKAKDDYQVVFSLAELDPEIRETQIIVADLKDGNPLDSQEGPLRLVDISDKKQARSVRMLTELQIVKLRK